MKSIYFSIYCFALNQTGYIVVFSNKTTTDQSVDGRQEREPARAQISGTMFILTQSYDGNILCKIFPKVLAPNFIYTRRHSFPLLPHNLISFSSNSVSEYIHSFGLVVRAPSTNPRRMFNTSSQIRKCLYSTDSDGT